MSKTSSNNKKSKEISPSTLQYCPQYKSFDARARSEAKKRFTEHVTIRKNLVIKCIDSPTAEIDKLGLRLNPNIPIFTDHNDIINNSLFAIDEALNKWNGVQISKKFISQYNTNKKEMDWKKFSMIAKNHQDQTSWKISGNYFFAPYIKRAGQFLKKYCESIIGVDESLRTDIYDLCCICYIVELLEYKIKFHRTKPKPLLRYKTLVNSNGVHFELEALCSQLKVAKFIQTAKRKRKKENGKSHVMAEPFCQNLVSCSKYIYQEQKKKVYDQLNIPLSDDNVNEITPNELLDSDAENDTNTYSGSSVSTYSNTNNSQSFTSTIDRNHHVRNNNHDGHPRQFQVVPEFGVAQKIRSDRKRKRNNELNDNIYRMYNDVDARNDNEEFDMFNDDDNMDHLELPPTTSTAVDVQYSMTALEEEQKIGELERENQDLRAQLESMINQLRNTDSINHINAVLPPPIMPLYNNRYPPTQFNQFQIPQPPNTNFMGGGYPSFQPTNVERRQSSLSLSEFDNLNALSLLNNISTPFIDHGGSNNYDEFQIPDIPQIPSDGLLRLSSNELLSQI
eukprot:152364_1